MLLEAHTIHCILFMCYISRCISNNYYFMLGCCCFLFDLLLLKLNKLSIIIYRIEIDTKLPIVGDQKWVIWICSFNVPMAPGKTRSVVCSARNFFQLTVPGPAWWQVRFLCSMLSFQFCLTKAHVYSSLVISMVFN